MKRRSFLKSVGGVAGAAALGIPKVFALDGASEKAGDLPRRVLGRTGEKLSVVGFPRLALTHCDQNGATRALHNAFEKGVNYFDVAPRYGDGDAEIKMGIGLQGLDRSKYFLACKTHERTNAGAQKELDRSLERLKTDHFDLYQLHHLIRPAEVKEALGPGGAMEVILKAKEQGKIKYIGFSAHTTKGAVEALKAFKFDTVMFPINFVEFYTRDFGKQVLEVANEQRVGVLAIKPLSWGTFPKGSTKNREWWYRSVEESAEVELAMRFALSQKGVVSGIPTSFVDLLDKTIEAAKVFRPLDQAAVERLKEMAANRESIFLNDERQVAANWTERPNPHSSQYWHTAHKA